MATTPSTNAPEIEQRRDALVGRLFQSALGTMDLFCIYLGNRLGFYQALSHAGFADLAELAASTGAQERYVREWLEQQAVSGILATDNSNTGTSGRRSSLPPDTTRSCSARRASSCLIPVAKFVGAISERAARRWSAPTATAAACPGRSSGPMHARHRPSRIDPCSPACSPANGCHPYLRSTPDSGLNLRRGWPNRLRWRLGCHRYRQGIPAGSGRRLRRGHRLDRASPADARAAALDGGSRFHLVDAADPGDSGRYDLVTGLEMGPRSGPAQSGARLDRGFAGHRGTVVVMDERVAETFTAPGDDVERLMYGFSLLCCLADGLAHAVGGHGHGDATQHAGALRPRGWIRGDGDPADRARPVHLYRLIP